MWSKSCLEKSSLSDTLARTVHWGASALRASPTYLSLRVINFCSGLNLSLLSFQKLYEVIELLLLTIYAENALQRLDLLYFTFDCFFLGNRCSSNACVRLSKHSKLVCFNSFLLCNFFGTLGLFGHLECLLLCLLGWGAVFTLSLTQSCSHGLHLCEKTGQLANQTALASLEFGKILLSILNVDGLKVSFLC